MPASTSYCWHSRAACTPAVRTFLEKFFRPIHDKPSFVTICLDAPLNPFSLRERKWKRSSKDIPFSHDEGTGCNFTEVVIDRPVAVLDLALERGPLAAQVGERLAQQAAGRDCVQMRQQQLWMCSSRRATLAPACSWTNQSVVAWHD